MRPWICVLCLASGCFAVSKAAYQGLVLPDRPQRADDLFACSVREVENQTLYAAVAIRLEHGLQWIYTEESGLEAVRNQPDEGAHPGVFRGRPFSRGGFPTGNLPCVMVARRGDAALGLTAWHFDERGYRQSEPTPITGDDLKRAAFVVYDRSWDRESRPRLLISIAPRSGRRRSSLIEDVDCMGCRDADGLIIGTQLAVPGWPSKGGMAAFAFLLPITLGIDIFWNLSLASFALYGK